MPNQPTSIRLSKISLCFLILTVFSSGFCSPAIAQWRILDIKTTINMRGIHAVSSNVCWIGGSQGTVLKTVNGGRSWTTLKVPGGDSLDFRDIHAFDKHTAVAMSAGEAQHGKAKIYRTENGGETWTLVYQSTQTGVFLDGIDFWDKDKGICLGDPINGRLFILTSEDKGKSWQELPFENRPVGEPGEGVDDVVGRPGPGHRDRGVLLELPGSLGFQGDIHRAQQGLDLDRRLSLGAEA